MRTKYCEPQHHGEPRRATRRATYLGAATPTSHVEEQPDDLPDLGYARPVVVVKPYFAEHAAGITVVVLLCAATGVIEATGMFRNRAGATKRDRGSGLVLRLAMIPAIALIALSPTYAAGAEIDPPLAGFIGGVVALGSGEALRIWSRMTLGHYFTYEVQTSTDQPVIQTGPYRVLRHPSYAGILLILIGFGGILGNWVGLAAGTALTLVGLAYRIQVEEAALSNELGEAYAAYARNHKRLIPFAW
jgi:protein-S-isoprenylcysteine O-methyltransferase Ste14